MAASSFLSNIDDDIDIDMLDNEVDDILNEEEDEHEDIELLQEDPLKDFPSPQRGSYRFTSESIKIEQERVEQFLQSEKPAKILEKSDPLDLVHKKELLEAIRTDKSLKTSLKDKRQYQTSKLPIIQFEELKLISLKIAPPSNISAPVPSALAVSESFILIGSRNGQILIFNHFGSEVRIIKGKKNFGQVTCLDITEDESVAIAGYHFGQVSLWLLKTGKCIRACNSLHMAPVLSVKFWSGTMEFAISGDLFGRVMFIEYGKSFMSTTINSSELFYDSVGPVLAIERLVPDPQWPHPTDSVKIVAIAGTRKILILTLENEVEEIYCIERPRDIKE